MYNSFNAKRELNCQMKETNYVIYQSKEAANAMMLAMEILPPEKFRLDGIHYISDETAAANLDLAEQLAVLRARKNDFIL